ncbi:DUF4403 family protein [Runella sp. MFBS21]|uniref:DUF4403 family protein n=1 Tax=Runella sp. MFBS21 TaxID=3034018 RepID=UPI0023F6365C|nr:DUF4403 family protein [Runella sp. MFBS21]MDF7819267.1 DUF4403 family protein [Runella sp. MFBS21]
MHLNKILGSRGFLKTKWSGFPSALGILIGSFWMISCGGSSITTQPKAPLEAYKYTNMQIQNEKHRSVVQVPVDISIADVTKHLNAQVQGLIYEDNSFEDGNQDNFKAKVWKRGPIVADARDSLLFYTVPLKIWAEKGYKVLGIGGSQATEFQINLKFMTCFGVDADWKVNTQTASAGFDWVSKPSIKVAGVEVPITGIVSRLINENLAKISQAIDDNIRQNISIKPYVLQAWNLIREPRLLSEEYRTWLLITPTDILMSPFKIQNGKISATVGIKGFTQTYTGEKPVTKPALNIPPLIVTNDIPQGFQIGLIGTLPYEEASKLAASQFVGKTFDFKEGKYKIEVTSVDIYGQNEKLIIKAGLKGSINGVIYLKGTPFYDASTKLLSLKNVDYDLNTHSVLVKTANWLLQGRFAKQIEQQFVFPVGTQVEEAQKAIRQQLTSRKVTKGVNLSGHLEGLEPDQVYLTPSAIVALIVAKGQVEVKIDGLL